VVVTVRRCPRCSTLASRDDRFCGACGERLARLRWGTRAGSFEDEVPTILVERDTREVGIEVLNAGVVPVGIVLRHEDLERLADWVEREHDEKITVLEPGEQAAIKLQLRPDRLAALFLERDELAPGEAETRLLLTTTLAPPAAGEQAEAVAVPLLLAGQCRITPAWTIYPFVAVEALGAVEHVLEFKNELPDEVELAAPEVVVEEGPALVFEPVRPATGARRVPPRTAHREPVRLRLPDGATLPAVVRASVRWAWSEPASRGVATARVDVGVGVGPALVFDDGTPQGRLGVRVDGRTREVVELRNPGHAPVRLRAVRVEPPVPWLATDVAPVGGGPAGEVPAGGRVRLTVEIDADQRGRSGEGLEEARVVVEHDATPEGRTALLVQAQFAGVVDDLWLGVDFGTTSSMATAVRGERAADLVLEVDPTARAHVRGALPSVLYYDAVGHLARTEPPLLVGTPAVNSAHLNPANAVRSLKSVVSRDPDYRFTFEVPRGGGALEFRPFPAQALTNFFVTALREAAEQLVVHQPLDVREGVLGLREQARVRFKRAVFAHPVDMPATAQRALFEAARACDLSTTDDVEAFLREHTVDEATAAVLAYVWLVAYGRLDRPRRDDGVERVVCVDIGGGTTDFSAVTVRGLTAPGELGEHVTVELEAVTGGRGLGGDDVDRALAEASLVALGQAMARHGHDLDAEGHRTALAAASLHEFREYHRARWGAPTGDGDEAYRIYAAATELRGEIELAKCRLEDEDARVVAVPAERWIPRDAAQGSLEVSIDRAGLATAIGPMVTRQKGLLDRLLRNARWGWDEIDTILFTGGGSRLAPMRRALIEHVAARRNGALPHVVAPGDDPAFDPKRCVSLGAAVWGASRQEGGWLRVESRIGTHVTFELARRFGPRLVPVVAIGTPFPVEQELELGTDPVGELELFRNGDRWLRFQWAPKARQAVLVGAGPNDWSLRVGGEHVPGGRP
jgi:molecular chaperone DnaK (HSP70)